MFGWLVVVMVSCCELLDSSLIDEVRLIGGQNGIRLLDSYGFSY